jgi:hypothetical protein
MRASPMSVTTSTPSKRGKRAGDTLLDRAISRSNTIQDEGRGARCHGEGIVRCSCQAVVARVEAPAFVPHVPVVASTCRRVGVMEG